ncbi:AAA family ATPase [Lichenicoccus sp.]|uniref:AAA family ATPase n=1 Tax=Lichenicoccus sp. TaxID=2781899 RepID=UPI003D12CC4A
MDGDSLAAGRLSGPSHRADRISLLAFVNDGESEAVLRQGLAEAVPQGLDIRRGDMKDAIAALSKMVTPKALIIDITGEKQPLALLGDLSQVVEPDVVVMVVGDREDMAFYRQVTRTLGAAEYLYKPLVPEMVARHFGGQFTRQATTAALGGRMVSVTGVRGGAGATTVAVNLAWEIAEAARRHTLILDADLHTGSAGMLLKGQTGSALRAALEAPSRIDEVYIDRAAVPVGERLYLLAAEEKLTDHPAYAEGAAAKLAASLRRRFNFVVADVPFADAPLSRDLLDLTQQRVLVLLPTLGCIRDTLRMLALPAGGLQARRAVLVLNRAGMPGGLSRTAIEDALQVKIDVCIPDLPRQVGLAEQLGEPATKSHGAFRTSIVALAQEVAFGSAIARPRRFRLRWRR